MTGYDVLHSGLDDATQGMPRLSEFSNTGEGLSWLCGAVSYLERRNHHWWTSAGQTPEPPAPWLPVWASPCAVPCLFSPRACFTCVHVPGCPLADRLLFTLAAQLKAWGSQMVPQTAPGPFAANYHTQGKKPNSFHHSSVKDLVLIKLVSTPAASFTWEGEQLCERSNKNKFLIGKVKVWVQQENHRHKWLCLNLSIHREGMHSGLNFKFSGTRVLHQPQACTSSQGWI